MNAYEIREQLMSSDLVNKDMKRDLIVLQQQLSNGYYLQNLEKYRLRQYRRINQEISKNIMMMM